MTQRPLRACAFHAGLQDSTPATAATAEPPASWAAQMPWSRIGVPSRNLAPAIAEPDRISRESICVWITSKLTALVRIPCACDLLRALNTYCCKRCETSSISGGRF
jgi:hypothetical protein